MKAQRRSQIISVVNIIIAYMVLGVIISLYDHFLLSSNFSLGENGSYKLSEALFYNVSAGFIGGLIGGSFLVALNPKVRDKSFLYGQVLVIVMFLTLFVVISCTAVVVSAFLLVDDVRDPLFYTIIKDRLWDSILLKNLIMWGIIFQLTQFTLQLQQKFGPGNMSKIFRGKYHSPKVESRIFMFLDLKSSTTIAERLGESKYHRFLQDVFADITDPISENKAEIYQYVGDEIIITWHLDNIKDRAQCIRIFFAIEAEFASKKEQYLAKYDTFPVFKAGAHIGQSIVGEIGVIKRDITYSGDLLNTTARIQGKCNELDSRLLISGELKAYLSDVIQPWEVISKGGIKLRGKQSVLELFSVTN